MISRVGKIIKGWLDSTVKLGLNLNKQINLLNNWYDLIMWQHSTSQIDIINNTDRLLLQYIVYKEDL